MLTQEKKNFFLLMSVFHMKISSHYGNEKQIRTQIIKTIFKLKTEKKKLI